MNAIFFRFISSSEISSINGSDKPLSSSGPLTFKCILFLGNKILRLQLLILILLASDKNRFPNVPIYISICV